MQRVMRMESGGAARRQLASETSGLAVQGKVEGEPEGGACGGAMSRRMLIKALDRSIQKGPAD